MRIQNGLRMGSALVIVLLAALTIGSCPSGAATLDQQTNEALLSKQVRHQLLMVPWYGVFDNLAYSINGREVTLTGEVVNPVTKSDAENMVKKVAGVTRVENHITVLPVSKFDDQIRRAEYRAIFSDDSLSRYAMGAVPSIHIIVSHGHVTLDGAVSNQMDHNIASIRARGVPGVFSVTNNLRVG